MITFFLVRHGSNDWLGKGLAGRLPNVHLNEQGRAEALAVGDKLAAFQIDQIVSSPMERARETAEPLAQRLGLKTEIAPEFNEIDFGQWAGAKLEDLAKSSEWALFNSFRIGTSAPQGETMLQLQSRFVHKMMQLRAEHPARNIAIFSHQDPIRTALCYWMGMPLDFYHRLVIHPASYSILRVHHDAVELLGLNLTA
jgi:broad specificity phosphatase PhoE